MKVTDLTLFRALQIFIAAICIVIPLLLLATDKDDFDRQKVNFIGLKQIQNCSTTVKLDTSARKIWQGIDSQLTVTICKPKIEIFEAHKINKDGWGFRPSLSHYAYSSNSYLFGMLYCMAAMLFIYNGVVYNKNKMKSRDKKIAINICKAGHWYNFIIGFFLIMVILNPFYDRQTWHLIFSILFFLGNIIVLVFFPNHDENKKKIISRIIIAAIAIIALFVLIWMGRLTILWAEWISLTVIASHLIMVSISAKKY